MTDGQLQIPERLELADLTADELQALTPADCFALLSEYTIDELDALRKAYFDEWQNLTDYLLDRRLKLPDEQLRAAQARLAEAHRRWSRLDRFHWWKSSGASLEHIKEQFAEWERLAEYERQVQEMWKARDAADLAAGKPYAVWRKLMADKKNRSVIFCQ